MGYKKKKDNNQKSIEEVLTILGFKWRDYSAFSNCGYDLEVYYAGITFKVEIKNEEYLSKKEKLDLKLSLTANELKMFDFCNTAKIPYLVVTNSQSILSLMIMFFVEINAKSVAENIIEIIKHSKTIADAIASNENNKNNKESE